MPVVKRAVSYRWTVKHVIAQKAGVPEYFSFDVEFKALPQSKVTELVAKALAGTLDSELFVDETMSGWHEMQRADESAWEWSAAAVKELCEIYPGMPASMSRAWVSSVTADTGIARKN